MSVVDRSKPSRGETGSRERVKSMARGPWVMMMAGVRLGSRAFWAPAGAVASSGAAGGLVREAESRFDDALGAVFSAGDRLQSAFVDWAFDTTAEQLDVRRWTPLAIGLLEDSSRAVGSALWPPGGIPWLELGNKLEAFRGFEAVEAALGPLGAVPELTSAIRRLAGREPYPRLWAMEGLGHLHAERAWDRGRGPGLLRRAAQPELPVGSLVPLHAGLGLSLAGRTLAAYPEPFSEEDLGRAVDRFLELGHSHAREGCSDIVFEALGLVVRNLYPELSRRVGETLQAWQPALADLFWHGVGRGLYFAPSQALPLGASWRWALDKLRHESPDERARRNALAGYSWALTLVNVRHPEVLADFVRRHGEELAGDDAFTHGVTSALLVWHASAGRDPVLETFLGDRRVPDLWSELVREPSAAAVGGHYRALVGRRGLAALFRYRPLAELRRPAAPPPPLPAGDRERSWSS